MDFPQDQKKGSSLLKRLAFRYTKQVNQRPKLIPFLLATLMGFQAFADGEQMGTFRFSEFSLSPRGKLQEPSSGGFELKESWIGFEWKRDESLSGEISFGTSDLIAPAIWYPTNTKQLQLVHAAIKAESEYFDVRAGLLPIPVGFEGSVPEWEWSLPETRVRSRRWFTRRDYGVEVKAETKPFLASLTVHNGESGENLDQKMWVAGLWRYLNSQGFGILMTGQVGRTDPQASTGSVAAGADDGFLFDPSDTAKFRHGTFAVYRKWKRHLVLAELGRGEILQQDQKNPFAWGHFDVCGNLGGDLNVLFRYEHSQSNTKDAATVVRSTGLGVSISSSDRLSMVTLWANKHHESPDKANDEALLIFRLNSNFL